MKPYLLDVNVLVALAWPSHVHYLRAQEWFSRTRKNGFRTCPFTQTGFVRISSHPSFTANAVLPMAALSLLDRVTALPTHEFWAADLPLADVIGETGSIVGHRQVTDAYLLALARARGGILATLDRGILALAGPNQDAVELLDRV